MVQDDTLTIAAMDGGNGVMADYTDENPAPWNAYASQIRKIVLSAGVANIGTKAFAGLNSLTNVTVPDSVQIDKNVIDAMDLFEKQFENVKDLVTPNQKPIYEMTIEEFEKIMNI